MWIKRSGNKNNVCPHETPQKTPSPRQRSPACIRHARIQRIKNFFTTEPQRKTKPPLPVWAYPCGRPPHLFKTFNQPQPQKRPHPAGAYDRTKDTFPLPIPGEGRRITVVKEPFQGEGQSKIINFPQPCLPRHLPSLPKEGVSTLYS